MTAWIQRGAFVLLAGLPLGCSNSTDPDDWSRQIGRLEPSMSAVQAVQVPATARAGEAFVVTITTLGSSSCTREDGASVDRGTTSATITPYDRVAPSGSVCTEDLHAFPRSVTLKFLQAGTATVRIIGRGLDGKPVTIDQTIQVTAA
jgi:hypothetical protein